MRSPQRAAPNTAGGSTLGVSARHDDGASARDHAVAPRVLDGKGPDDDGERGNGRLAQVWWSRARGA